MAHATMKLLQKYFAEAPALIIGSGLSASHGVPGMHQLAEHLIAEVTPPDGTEANWEECTELLSQGIDLETTLTRTHLDHELIEAVVDTTWRYIAQHDVSLFHASAREHDFFALSRLLAALFRSSLAAVDIITPNYDRLIEYACDHARFHHYSGFSAGYLRTLQTAEYLTCDRVVRIWKVHGSIDWFKMPSGETCALGHLTEIPPGFRPLIVTPGVSKYQEAFHEPYRTTMAAADQAIESAGSFLCVGFGFNDDHIQEKLVTACTRDKRPIVAISKELTDSARKFLLSGEVDCFVAIEANPDDPSQSVVYSSDSDNPLNVDCDLWSLQGYVEAVTS